MNGFLLIDKPVDWTSRDVCNRVQHLFHTKKVGHTGTLDPFATGLLIVTINNATKAGLYLENEDKEYIAELKLGIKTTTGDYTGEIIGNSDVPNFDLSMIQNIAKSFIGKQNQIPPMTSAGHYKGQKLYKLAHAGIVVDRKPKEIEIKSLNIMSYENNVIKFKCRVSKGTYIRVLGEDLANKLNTVGHLLSLRRTAIGQTSVEKAIKLNDIDETKLQSIEPFLEKAYRTIVADDELEKKAYYGVNLSFDFDDKLIFIESKNRQAIAIYEKDGDTYKCKRGLW